MSKNSEGFGKESEAPAPFVEFGDKNRKSSERSETPFYVNDEWVGEIITWSVADVRAFMGHQRTESWTVSYYEVRLNDQSRDEEGVVFDPADYPTKARGALAAARRWVKKNAASLAPVEAPAPEAPLAMAINIDAEEWGQVTYDDVAGLLCCAFEGGSNYWARVQRDYDLSGGELDSRTFGYWAEYPIYTITHPDWMIIVRTGDHRGKQTLKLADLLKGLRIMRRDYPREWCAFMTGGYDAITGDVFLQCATFGELVYC